MEPERKIEKLLRAYAQKRRAAAGEPLKLHPATRRLLQDEASRHAAKPEPEPDEPSVSLWQLFRQRWAFMLGFALMVFLGAMFLLPPLGSVKREAQSVSAMNNLKQIGVAAQMVAGENNGKLPASLDELTNGLVAQQTLNDPVSGKPFVYVAASKNLDKLQSNDVLAYSPAEKDGRAVLLADGRVEYADRERFSELINQKSTELALADKVAREQPAGPVANEPAATPPPTALGVAGELKEQPQRGGAQRSLVQGGVTSQQNLYQNASASGRRSPVLQSFQMVQNGDEVSVVDRDGSVYHGSVQIAATKGNEAETIPSNDEAPLAKPAQFQANTDQSKSKQQQAVQDYFFRVAGVNRTLQQNVVFSGAVEAISGTNLNASQTFAGGGGGMSNNSQIPTNRQQGFLSNSRVVGTAVIDQTNQIEVNAVPATQ